MAINEEYTVIDGENAILGRLASNVAKRLLNGEQIAIINAEKVIILGDPKSIVRKYQHRLTLKTKSNPLKGPFYPRTTVGIVKRTIRGMIPFKKTNGKNAYKRLRVYNGVPEQFAEVTPEVVSDAIKTKISSNYVTVEVLSNRI